MNAAGYVKLSHSHPADVQEMPLKIRGETRGGGTKLTWRRKIAREFSEKMFVK